jgi:carboxylesterase type B
MTLDAAGIGGNFATQDLILALEWVQSNIAAFGGDPVGLCVQSLIAVNTNLTNQKKVVLFGESAGATNTYILSTLPQAPSLFKSAIWESGAGPQLATPEVANTLGTSYASKLNCTTTDVSFLSGSSCPTAIGAILIYFSDRRLS